MRFRAPRVPSFEPCFPKFFFEPELCFFFFLVFPPAAGRFCVGCSFEGFRFSFSMFFRRFPSSLRPVVPLSVVFFFEVPVGFVEAVLAADLCESGGA